MCDFLRGAVNHFLVKREHSMTLVWIMVTVFIAGAIGGLVNAVLTDNGFALPRLETTGETKYLRPGWVGNVFVSGIAACVSWGLYGPFAATTILGTVSPAASLPISLTLSGCVGAVLVGMAGARWLTNEVDKTLLRAAGARAAKSGPSDTLVEAFALANPAEVLNQAQKT
jgi:hypothetical protein